MTPAPTKPHAGLLPFYLKLYDDLNPDYRAGFDGFIAQIRAALEARGIAVKSAPICRLAGEFQVAMDQFEAADVDCVVTLHLAYSPSLEALDTFCRTRLPIIILDATMDADFGRTVSPDRIMYNHGVHGVMDFASMLCRRRRSFEIVAGHGAAPRTLERAADLVRAAFGARRLRGSRVLRVGPPFVGMGDFAVAEEVLASVLGIHAEQVGVEVLDEAVQRVSDSAVQREVTQDCERFACELPAEAHARSVRVGLGLRALLETGGYGGFSVNFQAFDRSNRPANTMPFLEIAKAMARGVGYAGEGDVLTAALVGALARAFGAVTFTEIFCPDWAGESLFLSHMGEISPSVAGDRPRVIAKPLFSGGSMDPALLTCAVQPGPAVLVNLAPGPDNTFTLIIAPVEALAEENLPVPAMRQNVRAWVRPSCGVAPFLEAFARAGGTHHSALLLGARAEAVAAFGRMCGLRVVRIDA